MTEGSPSVSSASDSTTDTVSKQTVRREGRRSPFEAIFDREKRTAARGVPEGRERDHP